MIWPDGHACIKGPWLGWRQSVGEPWFPMGPSKILGGCDVRSQEFVPVQSCHISCQLAMSQSESAYSAIADWHWTTSNTTEVAIRAPYGDMGTSQRRNGDVRTWWHVGKIGPWTAKGQKEADETYSLDVEIPGLQPHGESCGGRRLPKISGIREEYILEWKFQKIIFQTFASAMQNHTNLPNFSVWIEVADP